MTIKAFTSSPASKFEEALKKSLTMDLAFRTLVWSSISCMGAFISLHYFSIDPLSYLDKLGHSILRLLNILGTFSLLICIPALLSKDLEQSLSKEHQKEWARGWTAGVIRRLAGDLTLWSLGATITLTTSLLAVITVIDSSQEDYTIIALMLSWLVLATVTFGFVNFYVRRQGPTPLLVVTQNPYAIFLTYGTLLLGVVSLGFIKPFTS